jgi:hypothetical protein
LSYCLHALLDVGATLLDALACGVFDGVKVGAACFADPEEKTIIIFDWRKSLKKLHSL